MVPVAGSWVARSGVVEGFAAEGEDCAEADIGVGETGGSSVP